MDKTIYDNFGRFGISFQHRMLYLLVTDRAYLQQIIDIVRKDYFVTEETQWLFERINSYFLKYKEPPTPKVLSMLVSELEEGNLKSGVLNTIKKMYDNVNDAELVFVKESGVEFCQNQELLLAVYESIPLLEQRKVDEMRARLDRAFKAGTDRNVGHIYKTSLDARMSEESRANLVPTPWDVINEVCAGGSAAGDLFVVMAPPGIGKTWNLISVGAHAIRKGFNVLHYSFELNEMYVGRRYDSTLSGIASQNLKYHKEDLLHAIGSIPGNLIIKSFPPKGASVNMLRGHIEKCILQEFKPDLIIVDYGDLVRHTGSHREIRHALENVYEDLRAMAGEFQLPVWTATQANRSSLEQDIVGAENVAEAFTKIMVADFILSLSRKIDDKAAGTGRYFVVKNRFGPDGLTFPAKIDTATGIINIYEESTSQGKDIKKEMSNGQLYTRKLIAKRIREIDGFEENPSDDKSKILPIGGPTSGASRFTRAGFGDDS